MQMECLYHQQSVIVVVNDVAMDCEMHCASCDQWVQVTEALYTTSIQETMRKRKRSELVLYHVEACREYVLC
jgi:hypothetical protein